MFDGVGRLKTRSSRNLFSLRFVLFNTFVTALLRSPRLPDFEPGICALLGVFVQSNFPSNSELKRCYSLNLPAILFCCAFATVLSINLISTFCTQFQLFALNFNFLHCLGLIDVFSANEHAEIFACILLFPLVHFISFVLIYSLWLLPLRQCANFFFCEGHLRRYTVTLSKSCLSYQICYNCLITNYPHSYKNGANILV